MRFTTWFPAVLIFLCIATSAQAEAAKDKSVIERILFDREVGVAGQRLIVTRGPNRDPSLINSLRVSLPEIKPNIYEVRVELRSPNLESVLLAARLRVEDGTLEDKGSVILDALIEPRHIVLAMGEGTDLALWHIGIGQISTCWTRFQPEKYWTNLVMPPRATEETTGVQLGRDQAGRLTVEVTEKLRGHHTSYEETEKGTLRFKLVREWKEKGKEK